jgi:hypothetical protein
MTGEDNVYKPGEVETVDSVDKVENVEKAGSPEAALPREGEAADKFVKETVESCRLFTLPPDAQKYYSKDRRDQWNDDSDEVMLLLQFFQNCLASGDSKGVALARRAFGQLAENDDDALSESICFVLLTWLGEEELAALFDPDNQPWYRRYKLAVVAGSGSALYDGSAQAAGTVNGVNDSKRERIFNVLKRTLKDRLKTLDPVSGELFNEALILAEFRDDRAIPLLRRYAGSLRDALRATRRPASPGADPDDPAAGNLDMIVWEIKNLGGDVSDMRA